MKRILAMLLLCVSTLSTRADDIIHTSGEWVPPADAYGQFRLVPSKQIPHLTTETKWNGPWSSYPRFSLQVGYERGRQTLPGNFHYVDPKISLQGTTKAKTETYSTTVKLFDRSSGPDDIKVIFHAAPDKLIPNQEYLAATISGDNALASWNLFVRFTEEKPDYVKAAPAK